MDLREHFTLREASARSSALGAEGRKRLAHRLAEGAREARRADDLFAAGQRAQALRYALRALRSTLGAASGAAASGAAASGPAASGPAASGAAASGPAASGPAASGAAAGGAAASGAAASGAAASGAAASGPAASGPAEEQPRSAVEPALKALGIAPDVAARIALAASHDPALAPEVDRALSDPHARLFAEARDAVDALLEVLLPACSAPAALARRRRLRAAAALGVAVVLGLFALFVALRPPASIDVRASAYRTADVVETWPPENVADRDEMTQWQLPAGVGGWIELRFAARPVRAVRLLNGHDLQANDRNRRDRRRFGYAARDVVVSAFSGPREVARVEQTLPQVRDFARVEIPIDVPVADRIRVDVLSYYGEGGGLAEVEVLP